MPKLKDQSGERHFASGLFLGELITFRSVAHHALYIFC